MIPRDELRFRAGALLSLVAIMWIVWVLSLIAPGAVVSFGIVPRTFGTLSGIITAPFVHLALQHLLANTIPLVILGALLLLKGAGELVYVVVTTALIAGAGTWLFGSPGTIHFGASGIVFGFIGFLLFRAAFDRKISSILITIVVAVMYGSSLGWAIFPEEGISWSGHFFGFVGGIVAARVRHPARVADSRAVLKRFPYVLLVLLLAAPLHAADFEAGVQHVVQHPLGDGGFDGGEIDVATSRGFAVSAELFWSERFSTNLAGTFVNPETILFPSSPPPNDVDLGTLGMDIYSVTARYHFAPDSRLSYYAGGGASYFFFGNLEDRFGEDLEIEIDPEVALVAEAGMRFRFRERLFLTLNLAYAPVEGETEVVLDRDTGLALPATLALDPVVLSVGASWRF